MEQRSHDYMGAMPPPTTTTSAQLHDFMTENASLLADVNDADGFLGLGSSVTQAQEFDHHASREQQHHPTSSTALQHEPDHARPDMLAPPTSLPQFDPYLFSTGGFTPQQTMDVLGLDFASQFAPMFVPSPPTDRKRFPGMQMDMLRPQHQFQQPQPGSYLHPQQSWPAPPMHSRLQTSPYRASSADTAYSPSPTRPRSSSARSKSGSRSNQSPITIKWLEDNYEVVEGVSLPRSSLYSHYLEFCTQRQLPPVNPASFGKLIRQQFPQLKTRRLGTRGQSKYHYYGIGVKANATKEPVRELQSAAAADYPNLDFPSCPPQLIPEGIKPDQVMKLLRVSREHNVGLYVVVSKGRFDDVKSLLWQFWRNLPQDFLMLLEVPIVMDMMLIYDDILMNAIGTALIPTVTAVLKPTSIRNIRLFANNLLQWMSEAFATCPPQFREQKLLVVKRACSSLKRKTSFSHLAQAARPVLDSAEDRAAMHKDWDGLDIPFLMNAVMKLPNPAIAPHFIEALAQFADVLAPNSSFDTCLTWVAEHFSACASQTSLSGLRRLFLEWSFVSGKIMMFLSNNRFKTGNKFHVTRILLDEYLMYLLEDEANKQAAKAVRERVFPPDGEPRLHAQGGSNFSSPALLDSDAQTPLGSSPGSEARHHSPNGITVNPSNVATMLNGTDFAVLPLMGLPEME